MGVSDKIVKADGNRSESSWGRRIGWIIHDLRATESTANQRPSPGVRTILIYPSVTSHGFYVFCRTKGYNNSSVWQLSKERKNLIWVRERQLAIYITLFVCPQPTEARKSSTSCWPVNVSVCSICIRVSLTSCVYLSAEQ